MACLCSSASLVVGGVVPNRLARGGIGLLLLGAAAYLVGAAIVDGPVVQNCSLALTALVGILILVRRGRAPESQQRAGNDER